MNRRDTVKRLSPALRQALKCVAIALVIVPLVPAIQVACLRFSDPTITAPIVWRWARGKLSGKPASPVLYEPIRLRDASVTFLTCVWLAEDMSFFQHRGFDWKQVRIALQQAHDSGKPARGASTITQQCARSLFLWHKRSWLRKGLEAYYTIWMEILLPKRRILELYMNAIEMGDGVYGLEAAAQHYYGIHACDLSLDQAAMLAVILPKPKALDPHSPSPSMLRRRAMILQRLPRAPFPLELTQ
jgi:monofunctional glycosyltransferase